MTEPIQLYIFDWSGTLSDDRLPVYEANMRVLSDHGKATMSYETWLTNTAMTAVEFFNSQGIWKPSDALFLEYKNHLNQVIKEGIIPSMYPETRRVLQELHEKGCKVMVVSAHPEENLHAEMQKYNVEGYIDRAIGNVRDKAHILSTIGEKSGLHPRNIIYIGDTVYDVRAAKEAGILSGAIGHGYHALDRLAKEQPDYLFRSLGDLPLLHVRPEGQILGSKERF